MSLPSKIGWILFQQGIAIFLGVLAYMGCVQPEVSFLGVVGRLAFAQVTIPGKPFVVFQKLNEMNVASKTFNKFQQKLKDYSKTVSAPT